MVKRLSDYPASCWLFIIYGDYSLIEAPLRMNLILEEASLTCVYSVYAERGGCGRYKR